MNRPLGRPPRISREAIAEAAADIGLEDLTLKAVAERLGVSVPGLYHHVDGRDDLLRLAAEHSVRQRHVPVDRGQHWAEWLLEWARYNREAFLEEPGLLTQYVEGAISDEAIARNTEVIHAVLRRHGFSLADARAAYELVSSFAIGAAVSDLRRARAEAAPERRTAADFDDQVAVVLRGIAARLGRPIDF